MSARTSDAIRHLPIASTRRWVLALIPPLVVFLVQWAAWEEIRPYAWFLSYPAIFASAWIGGVRGGLTATALSTALIWWFFLPPERSLTKEARLLFPAAVFVITCSLIALFHDRLHKTNARLRQASQRIASLVELAPEGIFIADVDGRYIEVNDAACRLLGYDRGEITGKTIIDLISPEDVARLERDKALLLAGDIAVGEWKLRRKDGTFVFTEVTAKILPDRRWQAFVRDITQRKQLETALQAKSEDLERAQSVSHVGSWRFDVLRNEVRWSDEGCRIIGVPIGSSMTYADFLACVHPEDREYVDLMWTAALRGAPYDIEHRLLVDGHVKWVREKAELELDERGVVVGGIGTTQDITERKQLEQAVRQAQERFELALRGADLATYDWDIASGNVSFNSRWAEMRGFHPNEISSRVDTWMSGIHPEDLPRVQKLLDDYLSGRTCEYEAEHRVRTKAGDWIWILDRGKIFARDERGQPIRMVGTELDITARKHAEEELRLAHAEQTFLADIGLVLATSLDYEDTVTKIVKLAVRDVADICIVDLIIEQGTVHRIEAVCRDPARAWVGNSFMNMTLDRSKPTLTASAISTGRSLLIERMSDADVASFAQSEEHLQLLESAEIKSMMAVPLTAYGRVIGAICLISSSPERLYGPTDLRLAEELGQRAAFAIENARLYSIAQRAISARDDLLGIVAHDLRNPLNSIGLYSEVLGDAEGLDERKAGEAIHRSVMRMNRLIQDLLDVTRLDSGRLTVEQGRVPTGAVIMSVIEAQRPLATSAGLELTLELPTGLPDLWADRDRLLQIFENLIGNALKFTEHGGISVGAAPREREVVFWVRDTGAGIPAVELPHLFDRFWQGRDKRKGAGLGLAIVKGLVEAHGGHIWVESRPDEGSCFYFTIPTAPTSERWQSATTSHAP